MKRPIRLSHRYSNYVRTLYRFRDIVTYVYICDNSAIFSVTPAYSTPATKTIHHFRYLVQEN